MEVSVITDEHVEILLSDLLEQYGYDFTGYSRASIKRRISRIYALDRALSFAEFRYMILNDQIYFKRFVEQITVNVTEMFRDPSFFRKLREEVLQAWYLSFNQDMACRLLYRRRGLFYFYYFEGVEFAA